jgi:transcriptional regulator with XRE-family HTH domain
MAYRYARLRGRIIEKYGSYSKFASRVNTSTQTVSAKLNGKSQFYPEDIYNWSEVLGLSLSETSAYFFE